MVEPIEALSDDPDVLTGQRGSKRPAARIGGRFLSVPFNRDRVVESSRGHGLPMRSRKAKIDPII
jgi:hypothetical protein